MDDMVAYPTAGAAEISHPVLRPGSPQSISKRSGQAQEWSHRESLSDDRDPEGRVFAVERRHSSSAINGKWKKLA